MAAGGSSHASKRKILIKLTIHVPSLQILGGGVRVLRIDIQVYARSNDPKSTGHCAISQYDFKQPIVAVSGLPATISALCVSWFPKDSRHFE